MFGDLQTQLQRLGRFLPKALDLPMVRFRDAFNEPRLLPFDLCREWKVWYIAHLITCVRQINT